MNNIAVGIVNYHKKYESDRCRRLQNEMKINRDRVFDWEGVWQLETRTEEYIAFWDVFDKWETPKLELCMARLAEEDADVIVHSYIQHVGLKGILYQVTDSGQADREQILCQGLPGISAMIFRREWLQSLLADQGNIEIGAETFYQLLFRAFTDNRCKIEWIAKPLSEHWSYYGSKTPSAKQAKDDMIKYWNTAIGAEERCRLLPICYEYFVRNYSECPVNDFLEGVSMNRDELAEVLRVREEKLAQQIQAANGNAERKNDFYLFMRSWVELHQSGANIADRLLQEDVSTVAIYGAGKHGIMLYHELKASKVKVAYWIDKNCEVQTLEECPVIGLDHELPEVDAVIVTPYREFQAIESLLKEKTEARIISLDRLVRR